MQVASAVLSPSHPASSFTGRLAGLIAELAITRHSPVESETAVSRFASEAVRAGELDLSALDASRALLEILADGFAARPDIPPKQIEAIVEPLAWGLLDRARF